MRGGSTSTLVAPGGISLSIEGDFKLGGHVFKAGSEGTGEYPFLHSEGLANTSAGLYGLMNVAPEPANGYGVENTAVGQAALYYTTTGSRNTGLGVATLYPNVDGSDNTAVGFWAMGSEYYPGGDRNIAVGSYAGFNTDGSDNILIARTQVSIPTAATTSSSGARESWGSRTS
jgi:hypothetical protein